MKERLKRWIFGLLGKDPDAVVVTFETGPPELCRRIAEEVRALEPNRRHFYATEEKWPELREELRRYRIGLAPVLLTSKRNGLRRAAYRLAPRKILAYNSRLERHHLRPSIASLLFWCGVPLDRIYLRPWWWPWPKREHSTRPEGHQVLEGRACSSERRRVAVLSPYFPYPLSHGGAVRIFNLLREASAEFDIELFAFTEGEVEAAPVLEFCARVVLVKKPRYREPRWSTPRPPEVHEYESAAMRKAIEQQRRDFRFELMQVEYTALARYDGDVLVEHDVTFDLYAQVDARANTFASSWDQYRWQRFEMQAAQRYTRVVVMSKKDAELLGTDVQTTVIENGVDLDRFRAQPERPGQRLLFIGSFRHFPNVKAYQFFVEQVWPLVRDQFPEMTVTVVAGPDPLTYWKAFTDSPEPPADPRIQMLSFVADVRPLYMEANLVLVPTTVSAGTNVKVLEAMAMQRAVVSTKSGCAGLGLIHRHSAWIGDTPEDFAAGIVKLAADPHYRERMADAAYALAFRNFDWRRIGVQQRALWKSVLRARRQREEPTQ
jgi:glycosyltransferase involved in cell wall biosynthesis